MKAPFTPLIDITTECRLNIVPSTLNKKLKERGLPARVPRVKPFLDAKMIQKRIDWCLERKGWSKMDWRNIIWTDETAIELGKGGS